jgi:cephalosporin hydroxylase
MRAWSRGMITMMDDGFAEEVRENIRALSHASDLHQLSLEWIERVSRYKYSYNFTWLGLPIIQFPQDVLAMQEVIWRVRPRAIIETGIARGGSLIFYASMLELLGGDGRVLGIDVDIRQHNRTAIETHPLAKRITMLQGSSIDEVVVAKAREFAQSAPVLVVLDSNHTHAHVRQELALYSSLVTKASYLVVFDTIIENLPPDFFPTRPWGRGSNPRTAVDEFLRESDRFVRDEDIEDKLLITVAPGGYLRCVKD